ncbi:HAD-IB family hydrolase [Actinomarinicola tropica]|uniref:HAD-IB family hydrolase n=1 Tax=Actinomarinicola tropica TaxID=2789776 RepID=UPI00189AD226|nr:HAD-IB family hydrolase [Actinomarinicola tropica]
MIPEHLDGRRVAITGATGFLGTALVERLLRSAPGCELVLLLRPGRMRTVEQRARREIFKNDAFDRLRDELGSSEFDAMVDRRVTVVRGDVGSDGLGLDDDGRAALASCDVVVHSAATVSFDSPLDSAVEVNLLGPTRIAATLRDLGVTPHLVAVSTCYVAGNHRGEAHEQPVAESPFFVDVPWRREVDAARRTRSDLEAESRTPEMLARFADEARGELGAAGIPLLSAKAEQQRTRWVNDRMVEAGRSRARSLGFPDVYSYTKALGEVALSETKGAIPVTVVRPSIIESAVAEPRPGWIRGFRMAEPVIISYARGLLTQFPGVPEGIVDVIPVDLVVAAIVAAAALPPEQTPPIVQVASGSSNPLRYRKLIDMIEAYFTEHPIFDNSGQPIAVPEWTFPVRGKVERQLSRAKVAITKAESTLEKLPLRGTQAELSATLESRREDVERALTYVELYGAYAECEAVYTVDRLMDMWGLLDDADRERFTFDPRVVDWDVYATTIHLPSVVEHARVKTTPGAKKGPTRTDRLRRQVLSPDRHLAAFDLENTLIASNVVTSYAWLATRRLPSEDKARFAARLVREAPRLLRLDAQDRTDFLRYFYRRYRGAPVEQMAEDSAELLSALILAKSFPAAIRRVREHRALGHRTVLITGALDFVVEPLRPLFDDIVAAEMSVRNGRYTGELVRVPPTGEARAQAMAEYAAAEGLDLAESVAYADSASDLPMLEAVGFPVAVNPETRLASLARKRGWLVENFPKAAKGVHPVLPIAPTRVGSR